MRGSSEPDVPLDLELAADLALCNSPQARVTWEAIKVQAGFLGEAKAAYLPSVTGSVTLQRERNCISGCGAVGSNPDWAQRLRDCELADI
jgi:outer membrane protein TolC